MPSISLMKSTEGGTAALPPPLGGSPFAFAPMTAILRMARLFEREKMPSVLQEDNAFARDVG